MTAGSGLAAGLALAALLAAGAIAPAAHADNGRAAILDASISSDTDGFRASRLRAGGHFLYENPWKYAGVAVQTTRYSQGDFREDAQGVVGLWRDQRRDTLAGVDAEIGAVRVAGHTRAVGDITWRIVPGPATAVEVLASADLVDAPEALERAIGYALVGVSAERAFGERFSVTGLAAWQPFTDGNARLHLRARMIWLAMPEHGVSAQLRYRQYASRDDDVGGAYFNPETYRQWLAVAAIRKRHAGWMLSGALGAGQERSSGNGTQGAYLAEARAEGPLGDRARLVLRAGYHRAAGFVDAPDYAWRYAGATLVVPL
ncbi:hypothetical protein RHIZO_04006 [Rhizobiaceae bacterium]|nr:hypothetical protein RHIZO_04006 [Rhizobiaceae bacterium]